MSSELAAPAVDLAPGRSAMPLLGFGTWQIADDEAEAVLSTAFEVGYRHVDTATGYGNEAGIGRALAASGLSRDEVFLTTKMPPDHVGRERRTLEESLQKLGVDHVDLWLVHWPPNREATPSAWEQFVAAREEGLATHIGVSNYSLAQIDELTRATGVTPAVDQIKMSPAQYDAEVVQGLAERQVVLEGYSPFRASDLEHPVLAEIARAHEVTPAQVIIAWHVAHQFVVIPKSSRRERMVANAEALGVRLTPEEVIRLDGLAG
ncbi:aldo/keto reductase [Auraticoccus sp. F435]|uniref:Aldo/keto reductase n=1 Tax=Auraticoccus cholistanensis TaxID=2656650 RepID=A0A6A9UQ02_9ACTN|nr:aldo/keto reductase [Auraticoccus cholistanensis]MVA74803.1 aldo/keto reductase [Auraticoccus cholistanensis]